MISILLADCQLLVSYYMHYQYCAHAHHLFIYSCCYATHYDLRKCPTITATILYLAVVVRLEENILIVIKAHIYIIIGAFLAKYHLPAIIMMIRLDDRIMFFFLVILLMHVKLFQSVSLRTMQFNDGFSCKLLPNSVVKMNINLKLHVITSSVFVDKGGLQVLTII